MTYSTRKKYATKAELTNQRVILVLSEATVAKIDAVECDTDGKLADVRGAKLQKLLNEVASGEESKAEVQRLQIQLASTKAAYAETSKKLDAIAGDDEIVRGAVKELQEKLEQAKVLADSRNKIIKSLMAIVNEVGF